MVTPKSNDNTIRLWRCDKWETVEIIYESTEKEDTNPESVLAFHSIDPILATLGENDAVIRIWDLKYDLLSKGSVTPSVHYINAKVVLVGESGVGKTGLGIRLAEKEFRETRSTHGANFWQISVPESNVMRVTNAPNLKAELTLWDLAGQTEYHIVHQLFLDHTNVALILFDCSDPNDSFRGGSYWAKVLSKQAPEALKYLISSRCDVSPVTVDEHQINRFLAEHNLNEYLRTSAFTGEGIDQLWRKILNKIPWDSLPRTTTPRLFQVIRELLLKEKEIGNSLIDVQMIQGKAQQLYPEGIANQAQIDAVISLLQAQGLIYRLDPNPILALVLLRPELINQYASAIIRAARNHPGGLGAIPERIVVTADFPLIGFERLAPKEELIVLQSTVELLIQHDLCFREMGMLIFPSQLNLSRPVLTKEQPPTEVNYRFSGSIEAIYASLVVRLSRTDYFQLETLWKYAAEFKRADHRLGFVVHQVEPGTGELEIYFYHDIDDFDRITFIHFIIDHLHSKGMVVQERIRLYCPQCKREVTNLEAIEVRIQAGELDIPCQYCHPTTMVMIPRSIKEKYRSDRIYIEKQQELTKIAKKRTEQEIQDFKTDKSQYTTSQGENIYLLHLSDLHLNNLSQAGQFRTQLRTDLQEELRAHRLDYLIISGDIAHHSTEEEYDAAFELVNGLVKSFGLDPNRIIVVPGNHDVNWDLSKKSYAFVYNHALPSSLSEGRYIPAGEVGALVRDDEAYKERFINFSTHFYKKVSGGIHYPLDPAAQAILTVRPDDRILFLALNSAWNIDHHFTTRASIHPDAIARALDQLVDGDFGGWLKIAVYHHPITGSQPMNADFMEQLAVHGFQLCLHGHIHQASQAYHRYDDKRGLHLIGAGTFGVLTKTQAIGIPPLSYNLLILDPKTGQLLVETRKREKPEGAWMADARWGDKNNPKPRYNLRLKLKTEK